MKRRKKPVRLKGAPPQEAREDLNAMSRALYGVTQADERGTAARDHESVEDPLRDWPDDGFQPRR